MFRCSRRHCDKKPKLTNPAVAFSPLAGFVSAGWEVDYVMCLRSAYALGAKITNDCAIHMLRRKEDTLSQAEHKVDYFYKRLKIPLAYTEVKYAKNFEFKADVVEPDSGRMGVRKDKAAAQKIHLGRTLVLKGRFTKNGWPGPCPTQFRRLAAAWELRPDRMWITLSRRTWVLRQWQLLMVGELSMVLSKPVEYQLTIGCIKGVMRRLHNVGRVTKSPHQKSIQSLSAAALHRGSGFHKGLGGHEAVQRGLLERSHPPGSEESLGHCSLHLAAQLGGTNRTVGTACKKEKALPNDGGVT